MSQLLMRSKSSFNFSCKDQREFFLNDLLKYLYILKKKKKLTVHSVLCFPGRFLMITPPLARKGHVSGNKELRHFKISNKNPSATLRSRWWAQGLEGEGSRCSIWKQGTAFGKAKWMHRQKQRQAENTAGEGPFPSKLSPGRRMSHHLHFDLSGLRTLSLTLHHSGDLHAKLSGLQL